jgi:hypothetical protein
MQQELIQQIVERTGISEDMATQAVNVVVGYVKDHAPAPVASQVENYLGGGGDTGSGGSLMGAAKGAVGGMFGKRGDDKPDEG